MKILTVAIGSLGDVYPLLSISKSLSDLGHEVILFSTHDVAEYATKYQLTFHPILDTEYHLKILEILKCDGSGKTIKKSQKYLIELPTPAFYAASKDYICQGSDDTLILCSISSAYAGRIVADVHQVRSAIVHYNPIGMMSKIDPARMNVGDSLNKLPQQLRPAMFNLMFKIILRSTIGKTVNKLRKRYHLPVIPATRFYEWLNSGLSYSAPVCCLGLFPDWFAKPLSNWQTDRVMLGLPENVKLTHFPLNDDNHDCSPLPLNVTEFLHKNPHPIIFTFGTRVGIAKELFITALEALRILNLPAIFLSKYTENFPNDLPNHILAMNYLPLNKILPYASLIVHHGGAGTTAQAFNAGIPQLIRPTIWDQFDNAARVICLEVGEEILPKKYNTTSLLTAIKRILMCDAYRLNANALKQHMKGSGEAAISQACDEVIRHMSITS